MVLQLQALVLPPVSSWRVAALWACGSVPSPVLLVFFLIVPFGTVPLSLDLLRQFLVSVGLCFRRPSRPCHTPGVLGTCLSLAAVLRLDACCPVCLSPTSSCVVSSPRKSYSFHSSWSLLVPSSGSCQNTFSSGLAVAVDHIFLVFLSLLHCIL